MNDLALYNEIDDFAADWLENLIRAGEIAPGKVDRRSIVDLTPDDVLPYRQVHLFAGIGLWSAALRQAGVRDNEPVWTGSCPCQPFSAAGKGGGFDDERHLWPAFHWLIAQCRPRVVLGEQVASKDGLAWLDLVQSDLEGTGYAAAALDICSAGFGAPHIRQRLYWVAIRELGNATIEPCERTAGDVPRAQAAFDGARVGFDGCLPFGPEYASSSVGGMALTDNPIGRPDATGRHKRDRQDAGRSQGASDAQGCGELGELADARHREGATSEPRTYRSQSGARKENNHPPERGRQSSGMANPDGGDAEPERLQRSGQHGQQPQDDSVVRSEHRGIGHNAGPELERPGPVNGFWRDADWLYCRDGKWRPVEAGTQPLAHGLPRGMGNLGPELQRLAAVAGLSNKSLARAKAHRVGSLRGYGNAINFEQAVEFIRAALTA